MEADENRIQLFLFGLPHVRVKQTPVHISRRKTFGILAYLTMHQQSFTRDRLASLFWPDYDYSSAHANLRKVLHEIRSISSPPLLPTAQNMVGPLDLNHLWVDAYTFQTESEELRRIEHTLEALKPDISTEELVIHRNRLAAAISLHTDTFMAGFSIRDCDLFDEWQFLYSEFLQQMLATNLEQLIAICEHLKDLDTAINAARKLVRLDSLNESGHRDLIRLYLKDRQPQAALRQYRLCEHILQKELGVEPEQPTLTLLPEIKKQLHTASHSLAASPLPFFRKETPVQTARAYQEVKLGAVEKLLRDMPSTADRESFTRTAQRAKELCVLADLTLRSSVFRDGNILRARKYYCRASHIDPQCSDAYSGLAFTFFSLGGYGVDARVNERRKVKIERLVQRSLEYDPTHSRAIMVLAGKKLEWDWDFKEAERLFQLALTHNPDHADTLLWYSQLLMNCGRFEEAYQKLQMAHELQPVDIAINYRLAKFFRSIGEFDKSMRLLNIIDELYPEHYLVNGSIILTLLAQGHYKSAVRAAEYGTALQENSLTLSDLAIARSYAGDAHAAETALQKAIEVFQRTGEDAYFVALAQHALGRDAEALDWLDTAYRQHDISLLQMCTDPHWTHLHWNSRFQELARKAGIPLSLEHMQLLLAKMKFPEHQHISTCFSKSNGIYSA